MYGANLSYEQVLRYLKELQEKRLLEQQLEEGTSVYYTTERGRLFLDHFSHMLEVINGHREELTGQSISSPPPQ